MIYFISDTHFFHKNICKYCDRPFSTVEEMNSYIIAQWNRYIRQNDMVYFLGDFGLGPKELLKETLAKLNRKRIILVSGNHDGSDAKMKEMGFDEVYRYLDISLSGIRMILSHRPLYSPYIDINISGHVHNLYQINGNIINVGVDAWKFRPISLREVVALFRAGALDIKKIKLGDLSYGGKL